MVEVEAVADAPTAAAAAAAAEVGGATEKESGLGLVGLDLVSPDARTGDAGG